MKEQILLRDEVECAFAAPPLGCCRSRHQSAPRRCLNFPDDTADQNDNNLDCKATLTMVKALAGRVTPSEDLNIKPERRKITGSFSSMKSPGILLV